MDAVPGNGSGQPPMGLGTVPNASELGGFAGDGGLRLVDALGARDERRLEVLLDRLLRDHALGDVATGRQLEHHVEERLLDDRPEPAGAGLALEGLVGDLPERVLGEDELDVVVREEALILAHERVLRLLEDLDEVLALQLLYRANDRQAADELGNQAVR